MTRPIYIWRAIAATLLFDLFEMLVTLPRLHGAAAGQRIFDMRPGGYSLGDAMHLLEALGPAGRRYYASWHLPADTLLSTIECLALVLAGLWLTKPGRLLPSSWRQVGRIGLILLPLATLALDYAENIGTALMLAAWPDLTSRLVGVTSAATVLKWPCAALSIAALLTAAIAWFTRRGGKAILSDPV